MHILRVIIFMQISDAVIFLHILDAVKFMHTSDAVIFMRILDAVIFMHILDAVMVMHRLDAAIFIYIDLFIFSSFHSRVWSSCAGNKSLYDTRRTNRGGNCCSLTRMATIP